jgi:hypothetical protein
MDLAPEGAEESEVCWSVAALPLDLGRALVTRFLSLRDAAVLASVDREHSTLVSLCTSELRSLAPPLSPAGLLWATDRSRRLAKIDLGVSATDDHLHALATAQSQLENLTVLRCAPHLPTRAAASLLTPPGTAWWAAE